MGLIIFNLFFLIEAIRRFIYPRNDFILLAFDLIVIIYALSKFDKYIHFPHYLYFFSALLIFWILLSCILTHRNIFLLFLSVRLIILPLLISTIGCKYLSEKASNKNLMYIIYCSYFWLFLSIVVGIIQIILGPDSPFSRLPYEVAISGGIDTYAAGGVTLPYLFRPTSFFMHTAKFGQILFILGIFLFICKQELNLKGILWELMPYTIILGIIVSGQRAAFLFYIFICGIYLLKYKKKYWMNRNILTKFLIYSIGGTFILLIIFSNYDISFFILRRFLFLGEKIEEVIRSQFILPMLSLIKNFPIVGVGPGYVTLGSYRYGGAGGPYLLLTDMPGLLEGTWIRIIAEVGFLGLVLYFIFIFSFLHKAKFILHREIYAQNQRIAALFCSLFLTSFAIWGLTHDTFANSLSISVAFFLIGPIFSKRHLVEDKNV